MTRTANVSTGPRVWLRRLVLTGAAVAVATQLSGYDLLFVAAVSALMVATVKGLQLEVSRSRRKAIGGREPLAPALPARARGTASPAMSVAVSTSDTEPSRSLRVLRTPDVGGSGTSAQGASPERFGARRQGEFPGSHAVVGSGVAEESFVEGAGEELGPASAGLRFNVAGFGRTHVRCGARIRVDLD